MPENIAPKEAKPKTATVPEGSVSPEGVPYQAPSRPFEEMDEPGYPPEVDTDAEEKLAAQREEAAGRYKTRTTTK